MMRKLTVMAAVLAAVFMLAGCVPTEKTDINIAPEAEASGAVEYDFTQIHNDTISQFEGRDMYGFVNSLDIDGDDQEKTVTVDVECSQEMDEEVLEIFAAAVLRAVNDAASIQNKDIAESTSIDLGSFWKDYGCTVNFTFAPAEDGTVPDEQTIEFKAGEEITLDPDFETYEEEWLRELEILKRNEE